MELDESCGRSDKSWRGKCTRTLESEGLPNKLYSGFALLEKFFVENFFDRSVYLLGNLFGRAWMFIGLKRA